MKVACLQGLAFKHNGLFMISINFSVSAFFKTSLSYAQLKLLEEVFKKTLFRNTLKQAVCFS